MQTPTGTAYGLWRGAQRATRRFTLRVVRGQGVWLASGCETARLPQVPDCLSAIAPAARTSRLLAPRRTASSPGAGFSTQSDTPFFHQWALIHFAVCAQRPSYCGVLFSLNASSPSPRSLEVYKV